MKGPPLTEQQYTALFKWFSLLIGLTTGAVIAIPVFLRDLFSAPVGGWLLLCALSSFAVSTLFSVFFISALTNYVYEQKLEWPQTRMGSQWVPRVAEGLFYLGFVLVSVFVVLNLYKKMG